VLIACEVDIPSESYCLHFGINLAPGGDVPGIAISFYCVH